MIYQRTIYEYEAVEHMVDKRFSSILDGIYNGLDGRISHYFLFSLHKDSVTSDFLSKKSLLKTFTNNFALRKSFLCSNSTMSVCMYEKCEYLRHPGITKSINVLMFCSLSC
jgi:hypothetical protein